MTAEQTTSTPPQSGPECRRPRRPYLLAVILAVLAAVTLLLVLDRSLLSRLLVALPGRPKEALIGVVDVFSCCILTPKILTTMLPTFLLGGAIAAFAPMGVILRYLGARSNQPRAYLTAALCGPLLSLCSCNIVPLFASIHKRGAGIGPAFTFLFAGPAINVVAMVFTFQIIGFKIGLWRAVLVPVMAILIGWTMSRIYRKEQQENLPSEATVAASGQAKLEGRLWALFGTLTAAVVFGAWEMPWTPKLIGVGVFAVILVALALRAFEPDERQQWLHETWGLVKLVVPVLLPAVLIIGLIATYIDVKLVYHLVGAPADLPVAHDILGHLRNFWANFRPILFADLFGEVMYFPVLTEVAFTKAFLKLGMTVGPALALLLTGPGTSLPGAILVGRAVGWKKALMFELLCVVFTAIFALIFVGQIGQYICSCMMGTH